MKEYKNITVPEELKERMDDAKEDIFKTDSVSYAELIRHLLDEYEQE